MSIASIKARFVAMFNFEKVQTSGQDDSIDRISEELAEVIHDASKGLEILVSLPLSGWGLDKKQTVSAVGVRAEGAADENDVWVYPPSDRIPYELYLTHKISCVAQGVDTVTFEYETIPTADITNVILNVKDK